MAFRSSLLVPARRAALTLSCAATLVLSPLGAGCGAREGESPADGESPTGGGGAPAGETEPTPETPETPACLGAVSLDVTAENKHGTLAGTLELPAGCGPFPAVVILPGSGPTDRDGNSLGGGVGANTYKLLAEGLRDRGIASIRYDKAGIGESAAAAPPGEEDIRFEMGASDAGLWVEQLRDDGRFATVTVVGHSEGSLIGMLVAQETEIDGYASIAGAGRPIGVILREQLAGLPDEDRERAYEIIGQLEQGELVTDVPQTDLFLGLFRPSVQPYLISWMKLDPAAELERVTAPILLVQGTTDIQVKVQDAELLAGARPDAQLVVIEGMSHTLKEATLAQASQEAAYNDPSLPVVPRVFEALEAFIPAERARER